MPLSERAYIYIVSVVVTCLCTLVLTKCCLRSSNFMNPETLDPTLLSSVNFRVDQIWFHFSNVFLKFLRFLRIKLRIVKESSRAQFHVGMRGLPYGKLSFPLGGIQFYFLLAHHLCFFFFFGGNFSYPPTYSLVY